jgi:hypothetical protein
VKEKLGGRRRYCSGLQGKERKAEDGIKVSKEARLLGEVGIARRVIKFDHYKTVCSAFTGT